MGDRRAAYNARRLRLRRRRHAAARRVDERQRAARRPGTRPHPAARPVAPPRRIALLLLFLGTVLAATTGLTTLLRSLDPPAGAGAGADLALPPAPAEIAVLSPHSEPAARRDLPDIADPVSARPAAWYLEQASAGDPAAQYEIAIRFAEGEGVAQDYARAAAWFREAAINGLAAAQYDLALLYESGLGLAADPIEAVIWFHSAADQGLVLAQYKLGRIYAAGGAVPREPAEAARWYKRAAEQGLARAQLALGELYEAGDGVARSPRNALAWYGLANEAGLAAAEAARARLAAAVSAEDAEAGRRLAARLASQIDREAGAAIAPIEGPEGLVLSASRPIAGPPLSRRAMSEIQRLLAAARYDPGPADGIAGALTSEAIRRYQASAALPVDGIPDAALLARLRAAAEGPPPAAEVAAP